MTSANGLSLAFGGACALTMMAAVGDLTFRHAWGGMLVVILGLAIAVRKRQ